MLGQDAADGGSGPLVGALRSVTISAPDVAVAAEVFGRILEMPAHTERAMLPDGVSGGAAHDATVFSAPPHAHGAVRVIEGPPREQGARLPAGWDCVELSVADVDRVAEALAGLPSGEVVHGPITVDLSAHSSAQHRSVVWRAPWGTHLILTQGVTQPQGRIFPAPAEGRPTGPVFEVHLRGASELAVAGPYQHALRMRELMRMDVDEGPIHAAWGLPDGVELQMVMLTGAGIGTGDGALEIQAHSRGVLEAAPRDGLPGGTCLVSFDCPDLSRATDALGDAVVALGGAGDRAWFRMPGSEVLELVHAPPEGH